MHWPAVEAGQCRFGAALTRPSMNRSAYPIRLIGLIILMALALGPAACTAAQASPTPASRLTALPRPATATTAPAATSGPATPSPTDAPARPSPTAQPTTATPTPRPPRLVIPEIKLDAEIVAVPIVDNAWNVDDLGPRVGWLAGTGDAPGDAYAPVLAGHVSTDTGVSGPFGYLWSLSLGGRVELDFGDKRYSYEVIDRRKAQPEDVAKVLIPDGDRLVLMTCDGWDLTRLSYDERLLVIAELVDTGPRP